MTGKTCETCYRASPYNEKLMECLDADCCLISRDSIIDCWMSKKDCEDREHRAWKEDAEYWKSREEGL